MWSGQILCNINQDYQCNRLQKIDVLITTQYWFFERFVGNVFDNTRTWEADLTASCAASCLVGCFFENIRFEGKRIQAASYQ